jgi:ComF family protein
MHRGPITALSTLSGAVFDFFYPRACAVCRRRLERDESAVCALCHAAMRVEPQWQCRRCGAAAEGPAPEHSRRCRLCPPEGAPWRGAISALEYHGPARHCVHLFKYHRRVEIGELMGRWMAEDLTPLLAPLRGRLDVAAPVPLHWRRRCARGFNQSLPLTESLCDATGIALDAKLLRRIRYTHQQARLPAEQRRKNVMGAFALTPGRDVRHKGVLLIDDVVTSGHTVGECARVLIEAQAREVWIACFARAGLRAKENE